MKEKNKFRLFMGTFPILFIIFLLLGCPVTDPPGTVPEDELPDGIVFSLSVTVSGPGTVTVSPEKTEYGGGESITLTAVPDTGNSFLKWSGDLSGFGELSKTFSITKDTAVAAEFTSGNTYYVMEDGTGNGSFDSPWGSIQTAVDSASVPASVFVSAGTYNESVSMKEGISLYGGFSAGFTDRKYETSSDRASISYKTLIANPSSSGEGSINEPVAAVVFDGTPAAITNSTVIEGFTINSGVGDYDAAIRCLAGGSPAIRCNTVTGIGDGTNTSGSYGIFSDSSSPLITHNTVTGNTTGSYLGYGISCSQVTGDLEISYNTVYGGDNIQGRGSGIGIQISDSSGAEPVIEYNFITGGGKTAQTK